MESRGGSHKAPTTYEECMKGTRGVFEKRNKMMMEAGVDTFASNKWHE